MKFSTLMATAATAAFLTAAPLANAQDHINQDADIVTDIINKEGATIGSLHLFAGTAGVVAYLKASGLEPGAHGMHFHMVGECNDDSDFADAGNLHGAHEKPHGALADVDDHHTGVLPNLIVGKDGTVEVELYSTTVHFDKGPGALLDADGASLVIHETPDDHVTADAGGSGERIACAIIKR